MKALALAVAIFMVPVAAQAATKKHHRSPHMSQQVRGSYAYQPQIACTQVGCLPVPRGCFPTGGRTFSGMPSGFDVMACPGGDMYGHR
jgi:hypothetical protein